MPQNYYFILEHLHYVWITVNTTVKKINNNNNNDNSNGLKNDEKVHEIYQPNIGHLKNAQHINEFLP